MWVETSRPLVSRPLKDFRFYAIIGSWYESDIIAATVKHAFTQGCDRVYIVDNDSPDGTAQAAVAAGAILAASYSSEGHDEPRRLQIMNDVVTKVSAEDSAEHIWWLWLDADEFPRAPGGVTVREFLARLDRRYRIVGAERVDHFPTSRPHYIPGFHPQEFMEMCQVFSGAFFGFCRQGHWKHPLQRFDRGRPPITCGAGLHAASSDEQLFEPPTVIWENHFPYRDKEFTMRRLDALCAPKGGAAARSKQVDDFVGGTAGATKRYRTMESVYSGRWHEVDNLSMTGSAYGVNPTPWSSVVGPEDTKIKRWYSEADLAAAIRSQKT